MVRPPVTAAVVVRLVFSLVGVVRELRRSKWTRFSAAADLLPDVCRSSSLAVVRS
jgi:hypothetical protein